MQRRTEGASQINNPLVRGRLRNVVTTYLYVSCAPARKYAKVEAKERMRTMDRDISNLEGRNG